MTSPQNPARRHLNTLMTRAFRQLRSSIYQGSSLIELNVQQLRTLFLLHIQETTSMSEISNRLDVNLPTVTSLVSKLEDKGLVLREHDTKDRRVVNCTITERGKAEIEQLWSIRKEQIAKLAESMSEKDVKLVTQAMEIILETLNRNQKEPEIPNGESSSSDDNPEEASSNKPR